MGQNVPPHRQLAQDARLWTEKAHVARAGNLHDEEDACLRRAQACALTSLALAFSEQHLFVTVDRGN